MRFARTFKPHVEIDRLTASAVIAMVTLSVISVLPTVMMDQLPFPASLSLGVAVVLVLRFDRRFAAYYALTASIVALVKIGDLVSIEPGIGAIVFTAMVFLSLLAAMSFNPHEVRMESGHD